LISVENAMVREIFSEILTLHVATSIPHVVEISIPSLVIGFYSQRPFWATYSDFRTFAAIDFYFRISGAEIY